jgi:hypothetical protein
MDFAFAPGATKYDGIIVKKALYFMQEVQRLATSVTFTQQFLKLFF